MLWCEVIFRCFRCGACSSDCFARLATYVQVMHLRSYVLTHNTICNLLHNSAVLFPLCWMCVMSVCESEKSEMKVRFYRCTMWKAHLGFSMAPNNCVRVPPVRSYQATAKVCTCLNSKECRGAKTGMRASAQYRNALKNMRAVRCLPPPAQIVEYSLKSRSRVFRSEEVGKHLSFFLHRF